MSKKQLPQWLLEKLPSFQSATFLPPRFNDSTHELWRLEDVAINAKEQANCFLKICSNTDSPFWQIMQDLFNVNLSNEIGNFNKLYPLIEASTPLQIPSLVETSIVTKKSYLVATEIKGTAVEGVSLTMVEQLALHLAGLHQKKYDRWGALSQLNNTGSSEYEAAQWALKLKQTIRTFSTEQNIPNTILTTALEACQYADSTKFVALMPDLRWDQFLQQEGKLTALVDLDAFVLAPVELDFVLLEYLLTDKELAVFIEIYRKVHPVPDIQQVRPVYRLLLFLMNVLGEQDVEKWMNKS